MKPRPSKSSTHSPSLEGSGRAVKSRRRLEVSETMQGVGEDPKKRSKRSLGVGEGGEEEWRQLGEETCKNDMIARVLCSISVLILQRIEAS